MDEVVADRAEGVELVAAGMVAAGSVAVGSAAAALVVVE